MKPISSTLIFISGLILLACSVSSSSDNAGLKRQDILGSWKISEESSQKIKNETAENEIITYCQLNDDSTVILAFGESMKKKMTGTWIWKAQKKLGNKNFGFMLESDVVIHADSLFEKYILALQLYKTDGGLELTGCDYTFKKQK